MNYVISDIHGCCSQYTEILSKISFSDEDELFVLGDVVDRGPEPIKVLRDMMMRPNVTLILGNHEYIMYKVLSKLAVEITDENAENHVTADDLMDFTYWMQDGGGVTMEQFRRLDAEEQADILDYISDASAYEIVRAGGKRYVLVHAGINDFQPGKALDDYDYSDFLFYRADYGRRYFMDQNTYLVTGHTPTPSIREDKRPEVYCENGHIAMDCGCFFSGRLACLCLETGEVVYAGEDKENLSQE